MTEAKIPEVGLPEPGKQTSPITDESSDPGGSSRALCYFNGAAYSTGAYVCSGGRRLVCFSNGNWGNAGNC